MLYFMEYPPLQKGWFGWIGCTPILGNMLFGWFGSTPIYGNRISHIHRIDNIKSGKFRLPPVIKHGTLENSHPVGWLSHSNSHLIWSREFPASQLSGPGRVLIFWSYSWLVVWNMTFFYFPYIGNSHPNWLIFFRGVETTNQIAIFVGTICSIVHCFFSERQWKQLQRRFKLKGVSPLAFW